MIAISNDFKTAMKQPVKELQAYIIGDININSENNLISFKISCDSGLCKTAMRKLEAKYLGEHNLLGQWVHVGFGVKLPNGTFEYLYYGSFLVTEMTTSKDTGVTNIVGYDKMINSMKSYTKLDVEYPMTLSSYTKLLCKACDLELSSDSLSSDSDIVEVTGVNTVLLDSVADSSPIDLWVYGNIVQNSTPTSSNPININTIDTITTKISNTNEEVTVSTDLQGNFLGKINDKVDSLDLISGVLMKNIGKMVVSEDVIGLRDNYTNIDYIVIPKLEDSESYDTYNDEAVFCEIAESGTAPLDSWDSSDLVGKIFSSAQSDKYWIGVPKGTTYEEAVELLSNTVLYYPLKETKKITINPTIINLYTGSSTVSIETSTPPTNMSIYYRKSNGSGNYNPMANWIIDRELWENIEGITYRDILTQIAQVTGTTCIISNDDKVHFKSLTDTGETLTYDNLFKLKLEPQYGEINSVVLSRTPQEDNIYMRDEESIQNNGLTEYKIENNEIIDKDRDNAMTPIYNILKGISYYPFEATTEGLGWYEIGDSFDIINNTGDTFNTSLFNFTISIDGGIKETLKATAETKTQTQYQYATTIAKRVKNTEIIVNKQEQYIKNLVTDVYEKDGVVNKNFTEVHQNINNIVNNIQNSGGNNLIKNSVMFAYDNEGNPNNWEITGDGNLIINSNPESLNAGCLSGHSFTLLEKIATQKVSVKASNEEDRDKIYYTFSTRIKKNTTGTCYVVLYNSNESHAIMLNSGESSFYKEYEIKGLLPKDNYYIVEFYGSADSEATFTDNMLAVGEYKSQWTQANGEIMNTQVNVNVNGVLVKSSVYLGDYTVMSPLEFAGYSKINGAITRVFSLNKDTTIVTKLKAEDEVKMVPIKVVPITSGDIQGWAFVPSTDEEV